MITLNTNDSYCLKKGDEMSVYIERLRYRKPRYYGLCGSVFGEIVIARITEKRKCYGLIGYSFDHKYRIYVDGKLCHHGSCSDFEFLIRDFHKKREKVISDHGGYIQRRGYVL